jgi:fatty acid synthase subunit alpha, fungi type
METLFEIVDEPDYTVDLASDADIIILLSKDWFEWADDDEQVA